MSHTITEAELSDYIAEKRQEWVRYATASGSGSIKVLEFNADGLYRVVVDHDRLIYIGGLKETAVREYNALP